ncbi:MAG: family 43 glycosylhydrolase [Clostridia bacterium]|nr:family 43 glycosylhydrolase [Clostridia bacterium]
MYGSFRPGKFWYDNKAKLIQAHGGAIIYDQGKFWLYGENKEGITGTSTGELCEYRHHGLRLYSSTDLYNWKNEGFLFKEMKKEGTAFHKSHIVDRPHILFNKKTQMYVMWTKTGYKDFNKCKFSVCVGKDLKHMKFLREFSPEPHNAGDFDLFEADGKAYVIFENPHIDMIVRELTDDYTGLAEKWSSHLTLGTPPNIREAPCYFERNGRRFILTSGTTSYFANPTIAYDITDIHGEWKEIGLTCKNDKTNDSYRCQFSKVFKHPFKKDLYIAVGDRWLNDTPVDLPDMTKVFLGDFSPEDPNGVHVDWQVQKTFTDRDTSMATYVWLPIMFDKKGNPYIEWKTIWKTEDFE